MENKGLPYSQVVKKGPFLFVSGQIAVDEQGRAVGAGDAEMQTRQALGNLFTEIGRYGCGPEDIAIVNVHMQNIERDFDAMNKAYIELMQGSKPARITVGSTLFKPEFLVEISATVYAG